MTQNPTTPEDDQHSRVDNAAQAPSGQGKDAQANAAGDSQGTGPLSFDRATANRQDASSPPQAPQDSHSAGSAHDHAYSPSSDSSSGSSSGSSPDPSSDPSSGSVQQGYARNAASQDGDKDDGKPKGRGMLSSWRSRAGKSADGQSAATAAASAAPEATVKPNAMQKIFEAASRVGPFFLLLILLAQAWPAFMGNALYCPREAESILVFSQTSQTGLWLAPAAPGLAHWPVYHWYLAGMQSLMAMAGPNFGPLLFPLAGLAGALLCLLGAWTLSRVAGLNSQAALAGGMILLAAPLFVPLAHFTGPESLATALTLFALALLCHGWQKPQAWISLPAGFVLAALAGLTGGLFHIMLPLVASIFFLGWRGSFRRAQGLDGVTGFVLLLLMVACWLGGVMLWQQPDGYLKFLGERLMLWPWPSAKWWLPLLVAAAGLLPWLAIVACVSWVRVLRTAPGDLAASRKDRAGIAFMWISVVVAVVLSLAAYDPVSAALTVICLAAPLLGKALLRLTGLGGRLFFIFAALCLLHAGMALTAAGFGPTLDWMGSFFKFTLTADQRAIVLGLKALPIIGVICIAAAVLLARMVRKGAHGGMGGALLICTVIVILLAQPGSLLLGPQLKAVPQAKLSHLEEILNPAPATAPEAPASETPAPEGAAPENAAPEATAPGAATPDATTPAAPAGESATPETAAPDAAAPQAPAPESAKPDSDTQASPIDEALKKAASEASGYDAKMMEEMDAKFGKTGDAASTPAPGKVEVKGEGAASGTSGATGTPAAAPAAPAVEPAPAAQPHADPAEAPATSGDQQAR